MSLGVTCNECGGIFGIKNYEVKKEKMTEVRFDCPHCKHSYLSFVYNDDVTKNQDKIRRIQSSLRFITNERRINDKYGEIKELTKKNEKIMKKLKKKALA